jgi:bifunctional DNA-binding transcriptional regulator/antitoxin component of YhaV-PrlF toxin-antitoxin module
MTYRTKIQGGQIVVPSRLRRLAGLAEGAPLDVTFEKGKLIMVAKVRQRRTGSGAPKKTPKQQRDEVFQNVRNSAPESLKAMWADSKRNGTDKMSMRQIDAIIADVRAEQAAKQNIRQPVR